MSSLIIRGDTMRLPLRDESVDAIVTDPPYMIGIAPWDHPPVDPTHRLCREERIIKWASAWGTEAYRVLRPGGYIVVCSSKRTIHLIASSDPIPGIQHPTSAAVMLAPSPYKGGVEMAGFECLGFLHWLYGTGQPRVVGHGASRRTLKPAWEPIAVLVKPPVPWTPRTIQREVERGYASVGVPFDWAQAPAWVKAFRCPPTIDEVLGITDDRMYIPKPSTAEKNAGLQGRAKTLTRGTGWTTSAHENPHESKKPVELMERLVRYVCPEGGLVLDPFCGSGTTGVACANIGRRFIGVERDAEYVEIAAARVAHAAGTRQLVAPPSARREASRRTRRPARRRRTSSPTRD